MKAQLFGILLGFGELQRMPVIRKRNLLKGRILSPYIVKEQTTGIQPVVISTV